MKSIKQIKKSYALICISFLLILFINETKSQAPNISYPQNIYTFPVGSAISPLNPINAGGATSGTIGVVSTLAGNSNRTYADGMGTAASFIAPSGIAVDGSGNVYVADQLNNRIRKISPAGLVTTLAGDTAGYADGTGSAARFNAPAGLAVDASGNVYVADYYNSRIRKISPAGVVTTLAGSGNFSYADGTGSAAKFHAPTGVAVDGSGNVYVADNGNHCIRKISPAGVVTTLAGSGGNGGFADGTGAAAKFSYPRDVAIDGSGNLYVAGGTRIRKISPSGVVTTFAGNDNSIYLDGTGTGASLGSAYGVAVDGIGNVYFTDVDHIRKINPAGVVTTLAGDTAGYSDGTGSAAKFYYPKGVSVDGNGNVYVADYGNYRIRKISQSTGGGYYISPALPDGLSINTTTGVISGTPSVATSPTSWSYRVTASNQSGCSVFYLTLLSISRPIISSFTPTIAGTGTTITIKGQSLRSTSHVSFGGTSATSFTVVNDNTLTAVVGSGVSGDLTVNTVGGTSSLAGFVYLTLRQADSLVLIDLYNSTNGQNWNNNSNWLTSAPINTWYGVSTDNNDRVSDLDLNNNNLIGSIPSSVVNLSNLSLLVLYNNKISGSIPTSFGNLSNINLIDLSSNQLSGTIPSSLGNLTNLATLNLAYNQLSGNIPTSLGNLNNLLTLGISKNLFNFDLANFSRNIHTTFDYYPQADIKVHNSIINQLAVTAGGTLSENTYKWYDANRNLVANKTGDSTYSPKVSGSYYVKVTNSKLPLLTLQSDTLSFKYTIVDSFTYKISNTSAFRDIGANLSGVNSSSISSQVFSFDASGWKTFSGILEPGKGYRAQFAANSNKTVFGTKVSKNVTPTLLSSSNEFSFVANPYNSVVDFNSLTKNNIQNGFWYLDPTNIVNGYLGYAFWGSLTGASNTYSGALNINRYIQPGQGFWVQNTSLGNGSLTFSTTDTVSGNQYQVFGTQSYNRISTGLFANSKNLDGAVVVFNNLFSNGNDSYDAAKFSNQGENITFLVNGKDYCANAWSKPTNNDVLPLHLYNLKANTTYTIKLDISEFKGNGLNAYLKDNILNTKTLLVGTTNEINFTTTSNNSASFSSRFSIVFGGTPLPVNDIIVSAKKIANGKVSIDWNTLSEINIKTYAVESSENGTSFNVLALLTPNTYSRYNYVDASESKSVTRYYRIKAISINGEVYYSKIVAINFTEQDFKVYPNPILIGGSLKLMLPKNGKYTIELINKLGQKVYATSITHIGSGVETIAISKQIPSGSYQITATDDQEHVYSSKLLIK